MNFWSFRVIISRIKAIRFMMADKTVPKTKKLLIIAGIVYFLMPIDLIPALVFPFSLIDDIAWGLFIIWYLRKELDVYWTGEKGKDLSKKYRKKRIIDDVEFEVDEDKAEKNKDKTEENKDA